MSNFIAANYGGKSQLHFLDCEAVVVMVMVVMVELGLDVALVIIWDFSLRLGCV